MMQMSCGPEKQRIFLRRGVRMTARYAHATAPGTRQALAKLSEYTRNVASLSQWDDAPHYSNAANSGGPSV
jgi:hypothetical protein